MINQLFRVKPDIEFINKLLKCFGLEDINDKNSFTKDKMMSIRAVEKITNLIPELVIYYLPCKYNQFLRELNENKCITILKQNIKLYDYKIRKKEYVINKVKIIYYFIEKKISKYILIENNSEKCIVKFN
jgi:hypothetical protein